MSDKYLKSLTFPDLADRYVVGDSSLSVSGAAADAKTTGDALATKAEVDGAYESMTVGNAEQLVGTTFEEDSVPYNFRTSGGSIDIGDREYDELVGGTVAWNQLAQAINSTNYRTQYATVSYNNGVVSVSDPTARYSGIRGNTIATKPSAGNKLLLSYDVKTNWAGTSPAIYYNNGSWQGGKSKAVSADTWTNINTIINVVRGSANTDSINLQDDNAEFSGHAFEAKNMMAIDLTQMFGSTIADYIYSLETANAGAGVAWFKKLFPKDYYAYNAGQLMSVNASSHNTVGFNALDGNNLNQFSENSVRTINNIPVVAGQTYELCCDSLVLGTGSRAAYVVELDAEGNETDHASYASPFTSLIVTMKSNTVAVRLDFYSTSGMPLSRVLGSNPCLHLVWDGERDGEYEEYVKHAYALDNDLTLRGIPKLDASDNLYYDGDTYESDGTVTRKWGFYTIQTSDITLDDGGGYTNVVCAKIQNLPDMLKTNTKQAIHSKYGVAQVVWPFDNTSDIGKFANNPATQAYWFIFPVGTTIEQMRTALSGTTLVYELATPTTEEADPYQNPQIVDDFGTEEYVDAGVTASTPTRDVAIPVGHNTKYQPNLRAKLEMLPNSPDGDGDYLMRQANGENSFVPFVKELPTLPSEDGTYVLKCTVSGSTKTLGWVEEE